MRFLPHILTCWFVVLSAAAFADRPTAAHLLPDRTLAYLRMADSRDFVAKLKDSSLGQILDDDEVRPLAKQLYGSTAELFAKVQDQVGLSLDELLAIPQGEVCLAVVGFKDAPPAVVLLLEVGDQLPKAQKLLDRAYAEMTKNGAEMSTETDGDTQLVIHKVAAPQQRTLVQFQREGVIVIASRVAAAKQVLAFWRGTNDEESRPLSDNKDFTAVMSRCNGTGDDRPQLVWYLNPVALAKNLARGNTAAQTGIALLPALGVDGVKGLGGSMILGAGEFESVQHFHLLLENPRSGLVKMIALGTGDATPEPWVPNDASSYATGYWDAETSRQELVRLVDALQGDGAFSKWVKLRISEPLGVDFEQDVLPAMSGRITYLTRFERPIRLNSQTQLLAIKLKDAEAFRGTLDKVLAKVGERFEKKSFGGVTYHRIEGQPPRRPPVPGDQPAVRLDLRAPELCLAILGDYFIAADSAGLLHQCVISTSDPAKRLSSELDFKLMTAKVHRQAGGIKPSLLTFNRPEEGMRMLYDLAVADNTRKTLASRAENNEFFKVLSNSLNDKPLPPFATFSKYLAPAGGMVTNDETGIHYTMYGLRRKTQ